VHPQQDLLMPVIHHQGELAGQPDRSLSLPRGRGSR
jgi:hypothetical protein